VPAHCAATELLPDSVRVVAGQMQDGTEPQRSQDGVATLPETPVQLLRADPDGSAPVLHS
jgi:hypothetical protein